MITGLMHLHSVLRWVLLILLIWSIIKGFSGWSGKKRYNPGDRKPFLFTMITAHIQLVLGLVLYFVGPWKDVVEQAVLAPEMLERFERFWKMEHIGMMVVAIILITLAHSKVKKSTTDRARFRRGALYSLLALLLIFAAIPWPFLGEPVARGLFPGM